MSISNVSRLTGFGEKNRPFAVPFYENRAELFPFARYKLKEVNHLLSIR